MSRIRLGVNIDHVATLREVRKASYPDLRDAMRAVERAGADQITVHLREDRRHIQDDDVRILVKESRLPINLEMCAVPEMIRFAAKVQPASITLVPERRAEMTTESGLNLGVLKRKMPLIKRLARKMEIHGFIDASLEQVENALRLELNGVEFHTGPFSHAFEKKDTKALKREIQRLERAASYGHCRGLRIKVGHGLTLKNVRLLKNLEGLEEANIGHAIVARSVFVGLERAVREMKQVLRF